MARSRNIKPGFFKNEDLADCGAFAMILFEGLWCHSDRDGKLEDRPRRLKAEILPYFDDITPKEVSELLDTLAGKGFILRYEVNEIKYIKCIKFHKHQNPHKNEAPSTIPEPENSGTSTVQAPEQHRTTPADSLNLIPLTLNPDSGKKPSRFTPPSLEDVKAYCQERGNSVDPVKFFNHYEAIDWMRGKNKIKKWKSCVITWEQSSNVKKENYAEGAI